MNLRLYDIEHQITLVEKDYSTHSFTMESSPVQESITSIDSLIGQGYYKEIYFDGVHIGIGDTTLSHPLQLGFESNFETIEMHFSLKGKNTATTTNFNKEVSFQPHSHNILYANGVSGKMQWEDQMFQLCEINLEPHFFKRFFPEDTLLFENFRNAIEKGSSSLLHPTHQYISHEMYAIIEQIIQCQRKGLFKKMFLEAKVIELLLLQLEQFQTIPSYSDTLNRRDIDKVYAVRDYILNNLDSSYTLLDLARHVGTNDFILKKGFKELFGTTVFSFWANQKMEQAKFLLQNQDLNISEISDLIGYKNPRHFSSAFKKKYGVSPSQWVKTHRF
ncbi:helix-turn-helix transcriptional regulator [Myroides odoratimimus]|uniref:helix-turn-helix transcriptional regulator n=1 Tax=Myroides odoratimimus TaxID=76832 RepID=UPI001CE1EEEA|nr:AraC family transcriptional regulator [Myroides odoratimimus]MCA4806645.1 helix-turn-helix transcriptional regulator [Myroides odoratimimus]MDM1520167.1 helix-turn-helix transcriptional regulator [Myroides odoratimimus]